MVTHDTRETIINYLDTDSQRYSLLFDFDAFQTLNDLIPEKEFSIVSAIKSAKLIKSGQNDSENRNITEQIRELAKLRDEGIITEQEFGEKKGILLDKIK